MKMLINIEKIKIEDRIRKDFGNIQELAEDIKQNGLINPPVVMQDSDDTYTLLTGERRIRALKLLSYKQVEVRTWKSLNDEEKLNIEISENESRKDFSKSERMEYALRLAKIEGLKAAERMKSGKADPTEIFPQGKQGEVRNIVATKLGIGSGKQFDKEKYIYENQSSLTPEDFADWDEGRLSTNKAYQRVKAKLRYQEELLKETQSKMDNYKNIAEKANELQGMIIKLESEIKELEKKDPIVKTEVVTKEVVPDDYDTIKSNNTMLKNDNAALTSDNESLRTDNARMVKEYKAKCQELFELRDKLKAIQEDSAKNTIENELQRDCIFFCSRCDDFIKKVGGYAYLSDKLNMLPESERNGYYKAIQMIANWANNIINNY